MFHETLLQVIEYSEYIKISFQMNIINLTR